MDDIKAGAANPKVWIIIIIALAVLHYMIVIPWSFKDDIGAGFGAGLTVGGCVAIMLLFTMVANIPIPGIRTYEGRHAICNGILFLILLPALILATVATGALMETAEAVNKPCPDFWCANRGAGSTGKTVGAAVGPAVGAAVGVALLISVVLMLGVGMQMQYLPFETRHRVLIFATLVVILPLLAVVTSVNVGLQKSIQLAVAAPPPADPTCCSSA